MLNPLELASLAAVRVAIHVRLWALRDFHRKHPSPRTWAEADLNHVRELREAIAQLRERERILRRKP